MQILNDKIFHWAILIILVALPVHGQTANNKTVHEKINYQLPHIQATPDIDGNISESVWSKALVIELNYETSPAENSAPPVKTTVYLFENGDTLYVAFDAKDSNSDQIRDFLLDRDNIWNSDFVGIKFDTFNESRKAFQFFTNARGIQADAIQEDFRGDDPTWDAIWESNSTINSQGYQVEMAIPYTALRFPATGKQQIWGFEALRFLPRKVVHRIANTPVDRNISCSICQYDKLAGFSKAVNSKNLILVPTLVASRSEMRDPKNDEGWQTEGPNQSIGMDIRWGITADTVLNATINPDFSQVEADAAQLDINNTFSIFLQEKRPFFLDGSDYFNSPNNLVHTRDIVEPDYGLKISGQSEQHSYGVFIADDQHTSFLLPASQSSALLTIENLNSSNQVLRYSYDLGNKNTIGALATQRTADGYHNRVASVDGKYWFNQNNSLTYQVMHSTSQYSQEMGIEYELENLNISGNAFSINYSYDTRDWFAYLNHRDFGKDFRADLGFIGRVDFSRSEVGLGHNWYSEEKNSMWNEFQLLLDWDRTLDSNGKELEQELEIEFSIKGNYQSDTGGNIGIRNTEWNGTVYRENFYSIHTSFEPIAGLSLGASVSGGDSVDFANNRLGESISISPSIDWQINQHWLSSIDYSKIVFDLPEGKLFNASVTNFRLTYQFNARSFLRLTLQSRRVRQFPQLYDGYDPVNTENNVNSLFEGLSSQVLYSYKVNPQTLFFAGYSDQGFQDDQLSSVRKTDKTLFMKFSYAWQL